MVVNIPQPSIMSENGVLSQQKPLVTVNRQLFIFSANLVAR